MSRTPSIAAFWDAAADSFDDHADHGLRDPRVREAWANRLAAWLPTPPTAVVDLGCGTGTLSVLVAELGHRVIGLDLSPNMVDLARHKLDEANLSARVVVADAANPPPLGHDVDLARHVLWTLPDPTAALRRWTGLLRPGGRLVLIEGRWSTATADDPYVEGSASLPWTGGVTAETLADTLGPLVTDLHVEPLTNPDLWGRPITDERYSLIAPV